MINDNKSTILIMSVESYVHMRWEQICKSCAISDSHGLEIWEVIQAKYVESGRYYHGLEHIYDLLLLSVNDTFAPQITDKNAVDLSIVFHDIIYDPTSSSNEEDSEKLFRELMQSMLPSSLVEKVSAYIIATKYHSVQKSQDLDLKLFIDFDMSILGRDLDTYMSYARKIRAEYSHIPLSEYCSKRANFLRSLLANETPIYASQDFSAFEVDARQNITAECEMLETGCIV